MSRPRSHKGGAPRRKLRFLCESDSATDTSATIGSELIRSCSSIGAQLRCAEADLEVFRLLKQRNRLGNHPTEWLLRWKKECRPVLAWPNLEALLVREGTSPQYAGQLFSLAHVRGRVFRLLLWSWHGCFNSGDISMQPRKLQLCYRKGGKSRRMTRPARILKNDATRTLMTGKELATHLKISKRTLATWRDLGRVPFIRFSARCFRYDPAAVERALIKTP